MSAPTSSAENELTRFRTMFNNYWENAYLRAVYSKEPNQLDLQMKCIYSDFGSNARRLCNMVLAEWLDSTDEQRRFAAFALAQHFQIKSMIPALQDFIQTHSKPKDAPERGELEMAKRVLERCMTPDSADLKQERAGD